MLHGPKDALNGPQNEAVQTINGPLMIIAGAGTGKTKVITHRLARLINLGIAPEKIVALTFTNKAAREMKTRVISLMPMASKSLSIGTFHSFCLKFLRRHYQEAKLHRNFSISSPSDQIELVRKSILDLAITTPVNPRDILNTISQLKNALKSPTDHWDENFPIRTVDDSILRKIYENYEKLLTLNRIIDFDDCIYKSVKILNQPHIVNHAHQTYSHFLVDEFQDTNLSQLQLLRKLVNQKNNICVVGDDDQSIYSWRGAVSNVLDEFASLFPKSKTIKLEQNYRCSPAILDFANKLISHNTHRREKALWSQNSSKYEPQYSTHLDSIAEARWIAKKCLGLLGQFCSLAHIAILYRTNQQAQNLETALRECQLNYKVFGGSSFFEKKEIRDFMAYLKLTFNQHDRISFLRVINTPNRGFGIKTLEKMEEASMSTGLSLYEILVKKKIQITEKQQREFNKWDASIKKIHQQCDKISPDTILIRCQMILKEFALISDLRAKVKDDKQRTKKIAMLNQLPHYFSDLSRSIDPDSGENSNQFMDIISLQDETPMKERQSDKPAISLMTIHKAKGLEFPIVFVTGLEEGLLPHENSLTSPSLIEEERRLFYVAITRAKERLFISHANTRSSFKLNSNQTKKSRFIEELSIEDPTLNNDSSKLIDKKKKNILKLNDLRSKLKSGFNNSSSENL